MTRNSITLVGRASALEFREFPHSFILILDNSIILVGRASGLEFREFEPGVTRSAFVLTINPQGDQTPLVVRCEGYGTRVAEHFKLMDEDCLVGVIGSMREGIFGAMPLVRIDRLEYLGKPLEVASA